MRAVIARWLYRRALRRLARNNKRNYPEAP